MNEIISNVSTRNDTQVANKKPKSPLIKIMLLIIGGVVICCCALFAYGSYQSNTPEGKITSTARAVAKQETQVAKTELAALEETETAKPTNTQEPSVIPAQVEAPVVKSSPEPTITSEPEIEDNAPTFEEFCLNSTTGGSTELQWDTFKERTEGSHIIDRVGVVRNVDEDLFGNYNLWIDIDDSYNSCSVEIWFEVSEEESLNIQKDQFIIFGGEVASISEMFSTVTVHLKSSYFNNDPDTIAEKTKGMEPLLGKIGEPTECGEHFTVTVLEPPEVTQSIGYGNTAIGKYFVIKVEIINNGSKTISGFDEDYFKIFGNLNDKQLEFAADWSPSYYAARRNYGYAILSDDIPPSLPWKTQVVFDVNPDATNFVFVFFPRDNFFDSNAMCTVKISLDDTQ